MPEEQNGTQSWKVNNDVFRGYMKASMDGLKEDNKEIKKKIECIPLLQKDNEEIKEDVRSLHSKVSNNRIKLATISGTIALIVTILVLLLKNKLF